jgi:peroxiredoxin
MLFRSYQPVVLGLALLLAVMAIPGRSSAAFDSLAPREDIPELPAPDGSSDTPEIEVTLIDGKKVKLSSLRGKVCVIDMFASWCTHCQEHAPHMVRIYNQFKAQGFVILSLATDPKDKVADVKKFIKDYGLNYPVGFLSNEVLAYYADNRNHNVPQVVLFGKNGKMLKRWIGWSEERTKEMISLVEGEYGTPSSNDGASSETTPEAKAAGAAGKATTAKATSTKAPVRRKK